jgi:hypothetical protein
MDSTLETDLRLGEQYLREKRYIQAENHLLAAHMKLSGLPPGDQRWLKVYLPLARVYKAQRNFARARELYNRSLRIMQRQRALKVS